jgi:hypothetical protein
MIVIKTALESYHSAAHIKQVIARDSQHLGLTDAATFSATLTRASRKSDTLGTIFHLFVQCNGDD